MEVPKEMALSQALGKSWLGEEGAEPLLASPIGDAKRGSEWGFGMGSGLEYDL